MWFIKFSYRKANINYAKNLYIVYEELLTGLIEPDTKTICKMLKRVSYTGDIRKDMDPEEMLSTGTTLFELYKVLQRFVE